LIGPNGAGKTSFIDAVTGFAKIAEGSISLDGSDVTSWSTTKRARAGVGRSFQALELFEDCSVIDNLRAASDPRDMASYFRDLVHPVEAPLTSTVVSAIRDFDLVDDLGKGVEGLSYGKRRLLAIARAVAAQPSVLLLDEPAAGLNDHETRELARLVVRLAKEWGMAILLVEHDINFVMSVCDDITVLDFGTRISHGTPAEVRRDPAVISAYLGVEDVSAETNTTSHAANTTEA
jgi:sulfate-transporting ATPase